MGLDYNQWRNGGYSQDFMAEVVALYRLGKLINAHTEKAKEKALKKLRKKNRK